MPDRRDFNSRRPPRRKSWDEDNDQEEEEIDDLNDSAPPPVSGQRRDQNERGRADARLTRGGKGEPINSAGRSRAAQKLADEEKEELSKRNRNRLLQMLGSQVLCLGIIFGLINTFNWMASDYSGDYMGQGADLRAVRLTITRRATTAEAELGYGQFGILDLDQSKDQPVPQADKPFSLDFATPEKFRKPDEPVWRANFTGKIENGEALGTITDSTGEYKVKLEKNVLTSIFAQLKGHIPKLSVPLPTLFDEQKAKPVRSGIQLRH
jgi:hypothetical protein